MKLYKSHKVVAACAIARVLIDMETGKRSYELTDGDTVEHPQTTTYAAEVGDYVVRYADGYESLSPKAAFEDGYAEYGPMPVQPSGMSFGQALAALKQGHRVARSGWNGKGMFVFLVPGSNLKAGILRPNTPYKAMADEMGMGKDDTFIINGHIDMKAADGSMVVGWLASQTDMLADDWLVVEG